MHTRSCSKFIAAAQYRLKPGDLQVSMTVIREATESLTNVGEIFYRSPRISSRASLATDTRKRRDTLKYGCLVKQPSLGPRTCIPGVVHWTGVTLSFHPNAISAR